MTRVRYIPCATPTAKGITVVLRYWPCRVIAYAYAR